jgi:hypothetical protein
MIGLTWVCHYCYAGVKERPETSRSNGAMFRLLLPRMLISLVWIFLPVALIEGTSQLSRSALDTCGARFVLYHRMETSRALRDITKTKLTMGEGVRSRPDLMLLSASSWSNLRALPRLS